MPTHSCALSLSAHRIDYAATLPMVMMTLCCIIHLREQNVLASIWMLMFCTIAGSFLTELWSRPHRNADRSYDMNRWLGDEAPVKPGLPWTRLAPEEVCQRALQQSRRRMNYVIRMIPHVLSIFPFVAMWVLILNHFFTSIEDLRLEATDDIYKRLPDFVPMAVLGTLFLSLLFFFPLWWWQWAPPSYYWKTEIVYPMLSVLIKYYIGYLLYQNMFMDNQTFKGSLVLDYNASLVDPGTTVITTTVTTTVPPTGAATTTATTGVATGAMPPPPPPVA